MARPSKKSIYERIESKQAEILNKEKELNELNKELQDLFSERDQEEMERLLAKVRESGLDIESALQKLSCQLQHENEQNNNLVETKTRRKRTNKIEEEQISLEVLSEEIE